MDISLVIAILSSVLSILSFAFNRKDKSNKDVGQEQYEKGKLDQQLKNIFEKLSEIEKKLDRQDKEIDEHIKIALDNHIAVYHHKGE